MADYPVKIGKATVNVISGCTSDEFNIKVIDYDGTVLLEKTGNAGDTITLPTPPTHDRLTFQEWSCSQEIVDNTVTFVDNDILVGATYRTTSGATEFDVILNKLTGLTITLKNLTGMTSINWGDGTTNSTLTHTYTDYGTYTILINGVKSFGEYVFSQSNSSINYYCTSIRFGNTVTSIGDDSFAYCYSIKTITIPTSVTNIIGSFRFCYSLMAVVIPSSVESIGESTFQTCSSIKYAVISYGTTDIGNYAFVYLYNVISIVIPTTVVSIGYNAFNECRSITSIKIPNSVTSIGTNTFMSCTSLKNVSLNNVVGITNYMFSSCLSLETLTIPVGVTSIGNYAFQSCSSLKNIIIPEGVTSINSRAFYNCYSITSIVAPSTITDIGDYAFNSCYTVTKYDFTKVTSIPTLANTNAFSNINKLCKIVVPDNLYDDWIVATNWSMYKNYTYKASEV